LAVNSDNEILEAKSQRNKLRWKRKGEVQQTPASLSYWEDRVVMLDTEGMLWIAEDRRGRLTWEALPRCPGAIDVMASQDRLYVLTDKQEILQYDQPTGWLRVAIKNGITYSQDMRLLMASDTGFWGLDSSGELYQAQHNSTHQLAVNVLVI